MKQIEKVCKATGCGKTYLGAPQSKFCSEECRKIRFAPEKPKFVPEVTLIKKETLSLPAKPVTEPISLYGRVKFMLTCSAVLDQVIDNIARKHKYKDPKHFVSHIEDMLTLYAQD